MGQMDNRSSQSNRENDQSAREILQNVTQDLEALQSQLSAQLVQDVEYLQGSKQRLLADLEMLETEYQALQAKYAALKEDYEAGLSRQQVAQQQLWAKRMAQALATHLQKRLSESIYSAASPDGGSQSGSLSNAYQLLASLDASLNETLHALQQDLNSYQSSLSQQISRMHSMEHQGEAILEALVNRLSQQLRAQMVQPPSSPAIAAMPQRNGHGTTAVHAPLSPAPPSGRGMPPTQASAGRQSVVENVSPAQTSPPTGTKQVSAFRKGLILIIFSTLALSTHNVLVGIIGYGGNLFGQLSIPGVFSLNIPNSLMLLWLRMLVVLPLMALGAGWIHPPVWRDLRRFLNTRDRRPLFQVIASGGFLFMSQVLIYKAISDVGPGVAVTLLFMYPLITVPLAWFLFGDRPTPLRAVVMFAITVGIVFTALPRINADLSGGSISLWGIGAAVLASAAFALYLVSMQLSFRRLHPVPVSLLQFTTIFVLTSLILITGSFSGLEISQPSSFSGLYIGGLLLGILTLLGYLFNNYGVRFMGAGKASIIASSGPVLTAVMAYFITPGEMSSLHFLQWIGVILVTLGVISLSFERLSKEQTQKAKSRSRRMKTE